MSQVPKISFKNPFQTGKAAIHTYDNIQSAYTYIVRHWKCSRDRAKEIFQAVSEGKDISNWPESAQVKLKFNGTVDTSTTTSEASSSSLTLLSSSDSEEYTMIDESETVPCNTNTTLLKEVRTLQKQVTEIHQMMTSMTQLLSKLEVPSNQILTSIAKGTAAGFGESLIQLQGSKK